MLGLSILQLCFIIYILGPTPGADEMVGMLVNNGLYDMAVIVCQAYSLQLHAVFTSLSLR